MSAGLYNNLKIVTVSLRKMITPETSHIAQVEQLLDNPHKVLFTNSKNSPFTSFATQAAIARLAARNNKKNQPRAGQDSPASPAKDSDQSQAKLNGLETKFSNVKCAKKVSRNNTKQKPFEKEDLTLPQLMVRLRTEVAYTLKGIENSLGKAHSADSGPLPDSLESRFSDLQGKFTLWGRILKIYTVGQGEKPSQNQLTRLNTPDLQILLDQPQMERPMSPKASWEDPTPIPNLIQSTPAVVIKPIGISTASRILKKFTTQISNPKPETQRPSIKISETTLDTTKNFSLSIANTPRGPTEPTLGEPQKSVLGLLRVKTSGLLNFLGNRVLNIASPTKLNAYHRNPGLSFLLQKSDGLKINNELMLEIFEKLKKEKSRGSTGHNEV
jgi:hypothetical protein